MANDKNHRPTGLRRGGERRLASLLAAGGRAALLSATILTASSAIHAVAAADKLNLLDLQVFAKQSITAARSDYEGPTAAGGDIDLTDFKIDGDLTSGRRVTFQRGQVVGFVNAQDPRLQHVFSSGIGSVTEQALEIASLKLDLLAARLMALAPTSRLTVGQDASGRTEYRARARRDLDVVDVSGDQLAAGADDRIALALAGNESAQMVVRVHGRSIRMRDVGFSVEGGLDPSRIVFFFPDAAEVEISSSGGAQSASGEAWDVPGSIVAPNAMLRFAAATVRGQVFARDIAAMPGLPSGQVDRLAPTLVRASGEQAGPFQPSRLLQMIDSDAFADRAMTYGPAPQAPAGQAPSGCEVVCAYRPRPVR